VADTGRLGLAYRRSKGTLTFSGEFSHVDQEPGGVLDLTRAFGAYNIYTASLEYRQRDIGRLDGSLEFGFTAVRPAGAPIQPFNGVTYAADVGYQLGTKIRPHIALLRAIHPSGALRSGYTVHTSEHLSVGYHFRDNIHFDVGVAHTNNEFRGVGINLPGILIVNSSTTNRVYGSMQYHVSDRLSVSLDIEHEQRQSPSAIAAYGNNRFGMTLSSHF
jgi:hypothetical protein